MRPITRFLILDAESTGDRCFPLRLGTFDEDNPDEQYQLCRLTASVDVSPPDAALTAYLLLPNGAIVGPIDLPFSLNVPTPVEAQFSWSASAFRREATIQISDTADGALHNAATYTVIAQTNDLILLPQGANAVSALVPSGTAVSFYTAAMALQIVTASALRIPIPKICAFVSHNAAANGAFVFHY